MRMVLEAKIKDDSSLRGDLIINQSLDGLKLRSDLYSSFAARSADSNALQGQRRRRDVSALDVDGCTPGTDAGTDRVVQKNDEF